MSEFFNVLPPEEARALLFRHLTHSLSTETIATADALGRVTTEAPMAPHSLPGFRRSTMDGYAVRAADTFGASGTLPAFLTVVAEVPMGAQARVTLEKGQAALVHTGGMIPEGADAVVQVELTQPLGDSSSFPHEIEVMKAVAMGENVLQVGEDVKGGSEILASGHLLRPQDLGGLLAVGITTIEVAAHPRVAILSSGDEIVEPEEALSPGQIRDINSYTIGGQVRQAGAIPVLGGIIPDDYGKLRQAAASLLEENDMLVMTAGSSVSSRDMTASVIDSLGRPGVLLHGVATRPGKPTIVAVVAGKPILGLPGNPVSAMIQFDMFGVPTIHRLKGLLERPRRGSAWARLGQNLASETGREDYVPTRLRETEEGLVAQPVFGKSNLIYTLVNADGLVRIPLNKGGLAAGELVEVRLF